MARAVGIALFVTALGAAGCSAILTYPPDQPEVCDNGVDDDADVLVDAADPDCQLFGVACTDDALCARAHLSCRAIGDGSRLCVPSCGSGEMACPAGWSCADTTCTCTPCVERCNGADDDCDGRTDETTCAFGEQCVQGSCACAGRQYYLPGALDLLLVIDDSASMTEEHMAIRAALPDAIRAMATGDLDGDGVQEVAPVTSLHVGVVTTDLGVAPATGITTCHDFGDDGVLSRGTACADGMRIFDFEAARDQPASFAASLDCAVTVGTGGCGFTQPLDAALEALAPGAATAWTRSDYVAPVFRDGMTGQGDRENVGFLRADSALAVVLVTDADDCSVPDASIFSNDPRYSGTPLNQRCVVFHEELESLEAWVDHLLSLRRHPADVFFAAIVGIPSSSVALPPSAILALPEMQQTYVSDPTSALPHLAPACTSANGRAEPARRIVQAAGEIACGGGNYALASICDTSFEGAFREILRAVASADDRRVCVTDATR